ncbi:MAG: VWA domain-containing protein [Armatimonadia bacterium]|nr:VWA domain-containing protein [Armatimonadia bacterium]
MNLLNPLGLLALLTIPPVILLYLLKLQRIPIKVPSTMLWPKFIQDMQANQPFQKLRFSILLLLQILILILVATAFARPYYQTRKPSGRSIVLILDASLSMQATDVEPSRFEAARAEALRIASELESTDEMMVVEVSNQTRVLTGFTKEAGALKEAIRSATPADCRGNLREALALSISLSKEKTNTSVYVLSDGATGGPVEMSVPEGVEVQYVPFGERSRNVAITSMNVRETYGEDARYQLFIAARNYGPEEVRCQVEISLEDSLIDVDTLTLPPGQQVQHIVDDPQLSSGAVEAVLDVEDDLPADDSARILFQERLSRTVLLVSEGNPWIEAALAADPKVDAYALTTSQYDPADPDHLSYDVTIFDRWAPPALPEVDCMLIAAAPRGAPVQDRAEAFDDPSILDWDRRHPVMRHVDLSNVGLASMMQVEIQPWAQSLVTTAAGPLMAAGETEQMRCLFVGFDVEESNFPLRVSFPIFIRNAIQWLTTDPAGSEAQAYPTGTTVTLRFPAGTEEVAVDRPDGTTETVPLRPEDEMVGDAEAAVGPATLSSGPTLTYDRTAQAGIYTFATQGHEPERIAFNVSDPQESDVTPQEQLRLAEGQSVASSGYVKSTQELWRWLALAGLAILCVEWIVYHRRIG